MAQHENAASTGILREMRLEGALSQETLALQLSQEPLPVLISGEPVALHIPSSRDRERSRTRLGQTALACLLLSAIVVVVCAAQTDLLLPETVRPVPSWLAGPLGSLGIGLGAVPLTTLLVLMLASYVVAVRSADRLSGRTVLACIAALHALVLLGPPLLSTDAFSYQAYGRLFSVYGTNPYLHGPHAIQFDSIYSDIGSKWVNMPTAYGPLFTALSAILATLSIAASLFAYKGLAVLASLAVVALVWRTASMRGLNPVKAAALVGLNPIVVVYGVGGGHNDLLMLALMVAAIPLVLQHREPAAGVSIVAASAIKLTGGLLAPFAIAHVSSPLARPRRKELVRSIAITTLLIAALTIALFGTGSLQLLNTLQRSQSQGDWHSIPGLISAWLGFGKIDQIGGYILGAIFLLTLGWLLRRVWRGQMDWIEGAAWATAAMLFTATSLLPWYIAWLMPLVALGSDRRLVRVAFALTAIVTLMQILEYIPHGASAVGL